MSQWTCRAALQRSVAKIFYHAGFEEFQPSALDAVTDIASNFFTQITRTFNVYREAPKVRAEPIPADGSKWKPRFTNEETILHALRQNGVDLEALDGYVKEDVERLGTRLGVMHERMKAHYSELLVSRASLCAYNLLTARSVLLLTTVLGQMAQVHSTTAASNSLVAILQTNSARISLDSKSWVSTRICQHSQCRSTCCKTDCTLFTKHKTPGMFFLLVPFAFANISPALSLLSARCGRILHPGSPSRYKRLGTKSASSSLTSSRSYTPTTTSHSSKTKTCPPSNAFRSHVCRLPARSPRRGNALFASSNKWPRRSGSSKKPAVMATRITTTSLSKHSKLPSAKSSWRLRRTRTRFRTPRRRTVVLLV